MNWNFLDTGFHNGKYNMEFDVELVQKVQQGIEPPTLRLYQWKPYAISIGYHQSESEFSLEKIRAHGIDIVRRPTGGQAIFHSHELTYSVVTQLGEKSLYTVYHDINRALLHAVRSLGIDAELVNSTDRMVPKDTTASIPCFAKSAKSEIQYKGKKLIGSAQRRYGDVVLQQGSFLLGPQHRQLTEFLNDSTSEEITKHLNEHATEAETILGRNVSFDEAQECVKSGFEEVLGITFLELSPDQREEQELIYEN